MALLRGLGAATLLLLGVLAFTPLSDLTEPAPPPPPRPADAIVVLGSYMGVDGMLSAASMHRAVQGITLYRRGLAPVVVMLGARQGALSEAEVRVRLAEDFGVPRAALLADAGGRTTRDEARRVRALLEPRGARTLLLVTSGEHMPRARELFEREGFAVTPSPVGSVRPQSIRPEDRLGHARRWAQELASRLFYRAAAWF